MKMIRTAIAACATVGLLVVGGGVGANVPTLPAAAAQENAAPAIDGIPATATLSIHKLIGLPSDTAADGTEMNVPDATPAEGITFHVFPINGTDLTTSEGWQTAQKTNLDDLFTGAAKTVENVDTGKVGQQRDVTTDGAGLAAFDNLPAMQYLVVEETNPVTTDGRAVAGAAPFLVTVPMTNPEGSGWLRNVHVYPKNQAVNKPVKKVTDPEPLNDQYEDGSGIGELIGYTITNEVPALGGDAGFPGFLVTDKLGAELGEPQDITVTAGAQTLAENTDYSVTKYQVGGQWVLRVELNGTGAGKLTAGENLEVNFSAPVATVPGNGTIENKAWALPTAPVNLGDNWDPEGAGAKPGSASNVTASKYGAIDITMTDENDANADFSKAEFELFRCTTDGDKLNKVDNTGPIPVGGNTSFKYGDTPTSIDGVHVGNVMPNDQNADEYQPVWTAGDTFCLVQTQAADGYAMQPQPLPVDFNIDGNTDQLVRVPVNIVNVKSNAGAKLPLTGGVGIWLLIGASLLALIYGIYRDQKQRSRS